MIAITPENSSDNQRAIPVGEVLDLQHLLQENRSLRGDRNYYKDRLERAKAREQLLKQEIEQLHARIRYLEKRLYGRKSEKKNPKAKSNSSATSCSDDESKRSRGHQPGSPGHGRRNYSHLPAGTIADGLKKLAPLFEPVLRQIIQRNQTETNLHADETRWQVFEFGEIFHLNNQRLQHEIGSAEFVEADHSLRAALEAMKERFESELTEAYSHPERAKHLNSLREHWEGLMVFVNG
jgi:hypothetical protein